MAKAKARASKRGPLRPLLLRLKIAAALAALAALAVGANFVLQIARKPTELLRYAAGGGETSPAGLWRRHGRHFRAHATRDLTPEFLAAMAYAESSGNPLAAPPWDFSLRRDWTRVYAPRSSAVGLFQFTDETFERARRLCVRGGEVARDGPWYDPRTCWFTGLSTRLSPSDSTEITAAYLQDHLDRALAGRPGAAPAERRRLAAVVHLCGPGLSGALLRARFEPAKIGLCAGQSPAAYVRRIERLERDFKAMAR